MCPFTSGDLWNQPVAKGDERTIWISGLALILRYVDDLEVREVAELMGSSVRATESLLVRARASLADSFEAMSVRRRDDE